MKGPSAEMMRPSRRQRGKDEGSGDAHTEHPNIRIAISRGMMLVCYQPVR